MTNATNKQVRTLSYNEMSSLMAEKISPHNCVTCIKFEGIIDNKIINQALMFIKKLFPCLTASIKYLYSKKYFFKFNNDINIPFLDISVKNININHYIENEINTSFNLSKGPLIRLTRVSENSDQWFLFTVHHAVSDGISIQYYIKHFFKIISHLVTSKTDFCFIPYSFHKTEQIVKLHKDFFKKSIKASLEKNSNSFALNECKESGYTKINNFSINFSDKFQDVKNITSILLSALLFAMQAVFPATRSINFVLPVNLRANMVHPKLHDAIGFHCSWIDFTHVLDKNETDEYVRAPNPCKHNIAGIGCKQESGMVNVAATEFSIKISFCIIKQYSQ